MSDFNIARFNKRIACMPELGPQGKLTPVQSLLKKRLALGLSRDKTARLLDVPVITLRRWELEEFNPSPFYEKRIFQLLGLIEKLEKKSHKAKAKSK